MAYPLFLTVRSIPTAEDIPALREFLESSFPHKDNRSYLDSLCGSSLPRVTAQRLGALALLPSLLEAAEIHTEELILRRDEHGRPYCETADGSLPFCGILGVPAPLDFNLSHTDSHAAAVLMVGEGRVGVDIEEPIPPARALPLIRRYCTEGELAARRHAPDNEAAAADFFTATWVLREALAKQDGRGMPLRFDTTRIPEDIWALRGYLTDTNTAIALCIPRSHAPDHPFRAAGSLPVSIS